MSEAQQKQKDLQKTKTCGSCSGFNREKLGENAVVCIKQGKIRTSKTCGSYRTDIFSLAYKNAGDKGILSKLASCVHDLNVNELQVMASLFMSEKRTRQQGYKFWQKVYVLVRGQSSSLYLDNFVVGRILDADKEYIRIVSETGMSCIQVVNDKQSPSFYTVERFRPLRAYMMVEKRFHDPRIALEGPTSKAIPTIDFAVNAGTIPDEFKGRKGKVRKSKDLSLVGIVKKMQRGVVIDKPSRRRATYDGEEIVINHV